MDGLRCQECTQELEELQTKLQKAEDDLDKTQVFLKTTTEVLETVRQNSEEVNQQLDELQWMLHVAQGRFEELAPKLQASQAVIGELQRELEETKEKLAEVERKLGIELQPPVKSLNKLKAKFKVLLKKRKEQVTSAAQEVMERVQKDTVKTGLMGMLDIIETENQRLEVKTAKVEEKLACEKAKATFNLTLWNGIKQIKAITDIKWKNRKDNTRMLEILKVLEEQLVLCGLQKVEEDNACERQRQQEKTQLLEDKDKLSATLLKRETRKTEAQNKLMFIVQDLQGEVPRSENAEEELLHIVAE